MLGFKKRGFHFSTKGFNENTFRIEDIFHNKTIDKLKISTDYLVKEVWSIFSGKCFTICYLHNVNFDLNELDLKQTWDMKIYVHNSGEEYWLYFGDFPTAICDKILDTNNSDGIIMGLIRLAEIEKTDLNQDKFTCKSYSESENFVELCKPIIWKTLKPKLNCTIASFQGMVFWNESELGDLKECGNEESAWNAYQVFMNVTEILFTSPLTLGCPLPCQQRSYTIDLDYSHANTEIVLGTDRKMDTNGIFKLQYYYKTLHVEERKENLVYDAGAFLAAAGGNLGLFLGFSSLSALFALISYAEKWIG